ncbi:hypothetical protein B0J11DRAFT_432719 [Dendryphion nanum]|uniref:Uncharacterized protein n=1 Tax=Dendryphion nanum TaxID=256645 RepID=A0A9P9DWB6_9PLEO|nr:hypothetical protein B0J11DRAFT_432719 [Dendryphion nanum]
MEYPDTPSDTHGTDKFSILSDPQSPHSSSISSKSASPQIPDHLTQEMVNNTSTLKRLQTDLLVLTGFVDNSTLHWRPTWFPTLSHSPKFWTLHNPPNVITEPLPHYPLSSPMYTRRLRRPTDPPPRFITDWNHWKDYCTLHNIPPDFLNATMIKLLRLGLLYSASGNLLPPPTWPLYPEPQPLNTGTYILNPTSYHHLPKKFQSIGPRESIVIRSTGKIDVLNTTETEKLYFHASQWTHYSGTGRYQDDATYCADLDVARKSQGPGRRWAYLPWTKEQEESCAPFKIRIPAQFWGGAGGGVLGRSVEPRRRRRMDKREDVGAGDMVDEVGMGIRGLGVKDTEMMYPDISRTGREHGADVEIGGKSNGLVDSKPKRIGG